MTSGWEVNAAGTATQAPIGMAMPSDYRSATFPAQQAPPYPYSHPHPYAVQPQSQPQHSQSPVVLGHRDLEQQRQRLQSLRDGAHHALVQLEQQQLEQQQLEQQQQQQ